MSSQENDGSTNIGLQYMRDIYEDTELKTEEPQPVYILHKDTIKAFLYEIMNKVKSQGQSIGLLGVEMTLIACLFTSEFKETWGLGGGTIKGSFLTFALIIGILLIRKLFTLVINWSDLKIDNMVERLGGRGSVIQANEEENRESYLQQ